MNNPIVRIIHDTKGPAMLTLNRRSLLKSVGSAAALAVATSLFPPRLARGQANFLDRINGGDDNDPLTVANRYA